jgi:hypothetical protein
VRHCQRKRERDTDRQRQRHVGVERRKKEGRKGGRKEGRKEIYIHIKICTQYYSKKPKSGNLDIHQWTIR